jgi:hypothetical protein
VPAADDTPTAAARVLAGEPTRNLIPEQALDLTTM